MKKIFFLFLISTIHFVSISCSSDNNEPSLYKGNWNGTIDGDIVGTWSGNVTTNGNFSGTVIPASSTPDHNFTLSGQVNKNGNLVATMKNTTYGININFVGNFQSTTSNGTWVFDGADMQGIWNGEKN